MAIFAGTSGAGVPNKILIKGQSTTIPVDYEIGDVAVANRDVCDYLVGSDRKSIYLNAKRGGETTVTLWSAAGDKEDEFLVRVVTATLSDVMDRVKDEFGDIDGIDININGGRVEIKGDVTDPKDFRRIEDMSRADGSIRSRVRLSDEMIGKIADAIRGEVATPGIEVKSVRDRIVLTGVAYNQTDSRRAYEIAKMYYDDVVNLIDVKDSSRSIGGKDLIELDIYMMEVKKSALKDLGINWAPGSFTASDGMGQTSGTAGGLFSAIGDVGKSLIGFVFQLVPKIRAINERGGARMLENPSVVVKSGETARVFSGSELPYYKGGEVGFKKVGIDIAAEPILIDDGVDIKIDASLSSPSSDLRGAVDTNSISTTAVCPFGQSLAIGNIVRSNDVKAKNRIPEGLDTSSALFTLFLSKEFQANRSEFVIFITPRLVKKPSGAVQELESFLANESAIAAELDKAKRAVKKRTGSRRWRN
jgi:pilus assembly protein CpaC